jgi:hypothetical protein
LKEEDMPMAIDKQSSDANRVSNRDYRLKENIS